MGATVNTLIGLLAGAMFIWHAARGAWLGIVVKNEARETYHVAWAALAGVAYLSGRLLP